MNHQLYALKWFIDFILTQRMQNLLVRQSPSVLYLRTTHSSANIIVPILCIFHSQLIDLDPKAHSTRSNFHQILPFDSLWLIIQPIVWPCTLTIEQVIMDPRDILWSQIVFDENRVRPISIRFWSKLMIFPDGICGLT